MNEKTKISRKKITRFFGPYAFLSNFYPSPITYEGIKYPTVEHAFQAQKTIRLVERRAISYSTTPGEAKKLGRQVELRPDWEEIKISVMRQLIRLKFENGSKLARLLLSTGDAELIEGNVWWDRFWGVCQGKGSNHLGLLLMARREQLK